MTVNIFLGANNKETKKESSIYVRVQLKGMIKNISTGIKLKPEFWDFKRKEIKDTFKIIATPEERQLLGELKDKLHNIKRTFESEFSSLQLSNNIPTNKDRFYDWCETTYNLTKGRSKEDSGLLRNLWQEYIDFQETQGMAKSTLKQYRSKLNVYKQFEEYMGRKYNTVEVDLTWWTDLLNWILARPGATEKSKVNHGEIVKKAKAVINHYAPLRDIEVSREFYHKGFKVFKGEKKRDWVTEEEFRALENFEGKGYLNNARDLAIIQYYTASRFGDIIYWLESGSYNIETIQGKKYLTMKIPKSGIMGSEYSTKTFPVHPRIEAMIIEDRLPHAIALGNYNDYIREIYSTLGMVTKFEGSHTFRRSFATHRFNRKDKPKDIMQFTGHEKESTLLRYIHKENVAVDNEIEF